jgi:hypothetical protein
LAGFNSSFSELLKADDQEETEEDDTGGVQSTNERSGDFRENYFGWLQVVSWLADLTHKDWDLIFKMNIYEFFNLWSFITWKDNNIKKQIEKMKLQRGK